MNQLDQLEDLKGDHEARIRSFLDHRDLTHLLNAGLFALVCEAMNDAFDSGRNHGREEGGLGPAPVETL